MNPPNRSLYMWWVIEGLPKFGKPHVIGKTTSCRLIIHLVASCLKFLQKLFHQHLQRNTMTLQKYNEELSDIFRRHQYKIFEDITYGINNGLTIYANQKHPFQIGNKKTFQKNSPHTSTCRKATRHTLNKAQLTANNGKANTSLGKKKTGKLQFPKWEKP